MSNISERELIFGRILAMIPNAKSVSNNKQIVCRCPICMDSANISSAHFYIGPFTGPLDLIQYDCKKCGAHGLFSFSVLRLFGIYDFELGTLLNAYNGSTGDNSYTKIFNKGTVHRVFNTTITQDQISEVKLKYINSRLGTNLNYSDIIANKIILNLYDFLNENHITAYTRAPGVMDQLNRYFIGFLSYDNGFINMRRLCSEGKLIKTIDKRYINYNVYNNIDNSLRYYIPPTSINVLSPEPIDVWVTEGPFDTLGVKYNLTTKEGIFLSVAGKSYLAGIRFIVENLGLININIHLCPDGDVDDWSMMNIYKYIEPFSMKISIHRNISPGQKDFGVSKDLTLESVRYLKGREE